MRIVTETYELTECRDKQELDGLGLLFKKTEPVSSPRLLAVNPRDGKLLNAFLSMDAKIDSFVSDGEWVEAAKTFSHKVWEGYSHHPLQCAAGENYDFVIVCEDMGYVDDCDAMLYEYYRLLKPGGRLLGGIWNVSYADSISALLNGRSAGLKSSLCGYASIPLDCLLSRLDEMGFREAVVSSLPGDAGDVSGYMEISGKNTDHITEEQFLTRIYLITAVK